MASNVVPPSSEQPKKQGNLSLFDRTDQEIKTEICATHVHDDGKYCDVQSLFIVVENILKRATLQGTQATVEHLEEKTPKASFSPPLYTLKSISCEMQCKDTGEETAYKTTMSILKKLSKYSWDAKAVLTLAAFALDYGEFWLLAQSQSSDLDKVAKSVGTLRGVSVLLKRPTQALIELNTVIKATLEVIGCIFELEKLSTGMDHIPVDVFWAIVTVVATTTQLCCLTSDDDKQQELSQFSQKLNDIARKLKSQITICREEDYRRLTNFFETATEILDVLKIFINGFTKNDVQPLIDGCTKNDVQVNIDILKGKNVLLLISGLDISDDDISILTPVYDSIEKNDQYKIVWIPIVDQWTDDLQKKFESLRSKMPWYVVHHFSSIGIRFVKEIWHFMGKTSVVVLNPQGRVEHEDAMHMICVWGKEAFPFTTEREEVLSNAIDLIRSLTTHLDHPNPKNLITDDQKYIFFYGGKEKWIQQFTERATDLAKDVMINEPSISIELVRVVGKGSKGEDKRGHFWTFIESLFHCRARRKTDSTDSMTREIGKLLSYKNESRWAMLSKGSNVVFSDHGKTIGKLVEEYDKWKPYVRDKGFDSAIKEHRTIVIGKTHTCRRIDIGNSGILPKKMGCPDCNRVMVMETYISFKCCHIDGAAN